MIPSTLFFSRLLWLYSHTSFDKTICLIMKATLLWRYFFSKALSPNTIALGVKVSRYNFRETDIQCIVRILYLYDVLIVNIFTYITSGYRHGSPPDAAKVEPHTQSLWDLRVTQVGQGIWEPWLGFLISDYVLFPSWWTQSLKEIFFKDNSILLKCRVFHFFSSTMASCPLPQTYQL